MSLNLCGWGAGGLGRVLPMAKSEVQGQPNHTSTLQSSAHFTSAYIPLAKTSHIRAQSNIPGGRW